MSKGKSNSYFSKVFNIILFSLMITIASAEFVCFVYLVIDAIVQASKGSGEYVSNVPFLNAFVIISIILVSYSLLYLVHLITYFVKKKRDESGTNIQVKLNDSKNIHDKEIDYAAKKLGADIVENEQNSPTPTYYRVIENTNYDKKIVNKFYLFLIGPTILGMFGLALLVAALFGVALLWNIILFYVLEGIALAVIIFMLVVFFYITPNKFYKKLTDNKFPKSVRIYSDRVEEIQLLADGEEVRYIWKYEYTKMKEDEDYIFLRTRNSKVIVGLLIKKSNFEEEEINYIKEKLKK